LTPPKGALGEEVLANSKGVNTLLIGAYGALNYRGFSHGANPNQWVVGSVAGGDAHGGSTGAGVPIQTPIGNANSNPTMGIFDEQWRVDFDGVNRANSVLVLLDQVEDMTQEEIDQAAAEARFLRGHFYFSLKRMFNMVPWIDENTTNVNQPNDQDIWPNIESDFEFAMDNLPSTQSDVARANSWAAASYLAKSYVYQQKWDEAKELLDNIIDRGVTSRGIPYELMQKFSDNWRPAKESENSEAVFAIQQVANDATGGGGQAANASSMGHFPIGPFSCCSYFAPTQDLVNSYRTTDDGLPMIDNYNETHVVNDLNIATDDQFELYSGSLDPRLDWTVGRRGVPYHDWGPHRGQLWVSNNSSMGVYSTKKQIFFKSEEDEFGDYSSWGPLSAINIPVIRFSDVLLLAAEVEVELGNIEEAREYVNKVRRRAMNPDSWVSNELNRGFATEVVDNETDLINLSVSTGDWVIVEQDNTTYVYLGGGEEDIDNWNRYEEPSYQIEEYSSTDFNSIGPIEVVRFERKLELAMEGHRFFDLARWGIAAEVLNNFFTYTQEANNATPRIEGSIRNGASFTSGTDEYYPIPQRQIDLSMVNGEPTLTQNPGY